jgi:hypothetical protein
VICTSELVGVVRSYGHVAILVVVGTIAVVYAYPGYMNYDAAEQLIQARAGYITDYHPPIIVAYWQFFELFIEGPITLLLLQLSLFLYGLYAILRLRFSPYPAAWITAAIFLFPPVFTTMAVVWKDSQMAAFLVVGFALAIRKHRVARVIGLLLLALAAGVRWNGGAALPPLFFLAVAMSWTVVRRRTVRVACTVALLVATYVANNAVTRVLADKREYNWYRTTAMFDIVGIGCHGSLTSDEEIVKLLDGTGLRETRDLKARFCKLFPPGQRDWYAYAEMFSWPPTAKERLARKRVWKQLVSENPRAWFEGRLLLAKDHLGLWEGLTPWEPICQDFTGTMEQRQALHVESTHSSFQQWAGQKLRWIVDHTPFYRPWIYVVAGLLLFGWAIWKRDLLVGSFAGSGLAYQLSIFLLANAPDFRFAHWLITCTLIGLALRYGTSRATISRTQSSNDRVADHPSDDKRLGSPTSAERGPGGR